MDSCNGCNEVVRKQKDMLCDSCAKGVIQTLPKSAQRFFVLVGQDGVPYNKAESQVIMPDECIQQGVEDYRCDGCDYPSSVCGPLTQVDVTKPNGEKSRSLVCQADIIWWRHTMIVEQVRVGRVF